MSYNLKIFVDTSDDMNVSVGEGQTIHHEIKYLKYILVIRLFSFIPFSYTRDNFSITSFFVFLSSEKLNPSLQSSKDHLVSGEHGSNSIVVQTLIDPLRMLL